MTNSDAHVDVGEVNTSLEDGQTKLCIYPPANRLATSFLCIMTS